MTYRFIMAVSLLLLLLFLSAISSFLFVTFYNSNELQTEKSNVRRLSEEKTTISSQHYDYDLEHLLHLATRSPSDTFTEESDDNQFKVLVIVTTLAEYDKGTRGTTHGADRLKDNVLPILVDGVTSMINQGWSVDVYLICGFETLQSNRRQMIQDALPSNVGLEVWEDAMPYYYDRKFNGQLKHGETSSIELASHGLSRQHRYVVKDKLLEYDFFTAFEDDMVSSRLDMCIVVHILCHLLCAHHSVIFCVHILCHLLHCNNQPSTDTPTLHNNT